MQPPPLQKRYSISSVSSSSNNNIIKENEEIDDFYINKSSSSSILAASSENKDDNHDLNAVAIRKQIQSIFDDSDYPKKAQIIRKYQFTENLSPNQTIIPAPNNGLIRTTEYQILQDIPMLSNNNTHYADGFPKNPIKINKHDGDDSAKFYRRMRNQTAIVIIISFIIGAMIPLLLIRYEHIVGDVLQFIISGLLEIYVWIGEITATSCENEYLVHWCSSNDSN